MIRFRFPLGTLVPAVALICGMLPAFAQSIPRTAQGKPDFSGFFDIPYVPNMAARAQPGGSGTSGTVDRVAKGESAIPYTEAGKAAYANHDAKDDPTANCWLPGVPRIMQSPIGTVCPERKLPGDSF
jgi:hypothetical protein